MDRGELSLSHSVYSPNVSVYLHRAHVDEVTQVPAGHTLVLRDCMRKTMDAAARLRVSYLALLLLYHNSSFPSSIWLTAS